MSVSRDLMAKPSTKFSAGESETRERAIAGHTLPRRGKGQGQQWGGSIWQAQRGLENFAGVKLMALKVLLQAGNGSVHTSACPGCHRWPWAAASQDAGPSVGLWGE